MGLVEDTQRKRPEAVCGECVGCGSLEADAIRPALPPRFASVVVPGREGIVSSLVGLATAKVGLASHQVARAAEVLALCVQNGGPPARRWRVVVSW